MPAAGGEATPIGRDAWLISLCGEPMQIENEMDRLSEAAGDGIPGSPELATSVRFDQQVRDRRNELISSIYATSVTTLGGLAAKAAVALRLVRTTLAISQHTSIRLVTRSRPTSWRKPPRSRSRTANWWKSRPTSTACAARTKLSEGDQGQSREQSRGRL